MNGLTLIKRQRCALINILHDLHIFAVRYWSDLNARLIADNQENDP